MQNPVKQNYLKMRQQIEQAASTIILAKGVEGLAMRELAASVQMSPANLYEYFDSKDDIVLSVFSRAAAALRAFIQRVDHALPAEEYLIALCLAYWDFAHTEQAQMIILHETAQATIQLRNSLTGEQINQIPGLFDLFQAGAARYLQIAATTQPALDEEEIAHTLLSLVYGLTTMASPALPPLSRAAFHTVVQSFLHGLTVAR